MKRRSFLQGAAAGGAISVLDWLGYFQSFGVPGTQKSLGLASAAAQAATEPHFLIYWFQEGGWDSYCMFAPLHTANDAANTMPMVLHPSPTDWGQQRYRPKNYGTGLLTPPSMSGNVQHGYLATDAGSLLDDMAVVSSHNGEGFHSGGRLRYHYGMYSSYYSHTAARGADERTVMQAFCEAYGASFPLANISWHRWLSDGELDESQFPEGKGYYEKLGPAYAHTQYGRTPAEMRNRLQSLGSVTSGARSQRIRAFVDDLNTNFMRDKNSESVRAFSSAVQIHQQLTGGSSVNVNPSTMFTDTTLRSEFNVVPADELTTATSVNGNPARSKNSPNTNVQAMMTYEMFTKGLSISAFIENRQVRGFDTHRDRGSILNNKGQTDQYNSMKRDLWNPLSALVTKLKGTPFGNSGRSYYDYTTIVLCSEMGRTMHGDVAGFFDPTNKDYAPADADKITAILAQDCCQHWEVNSVAFLGGPVKKNVQFGKVGSSSLTGIPIRVADGSLDPAYDAVTGLLIPGRTKDPTSVITDAGHVYSTALALSGLDPVALKAAGKGKCSRPPLNFIKK